MENKKIKEYLRKKIFLAENALKTYSYNSMVSSRVVDIRILKILKDIKELNL